MNRAVIVVPILRPLAGAVCLLLLVGCVLAVMPAHADARPRPTPVRRTTFTANKTFGLGLILGEPIGLTAKYFLSPSTALDFAFGEYDRFEDDDDLGVHADFLWHPLVLVTTDPFLLPLYLGIGGRVMGDDDPGDDDVVMGVRAPIGVALDFNRVPLDIFFELALLIDFIGNDENDDDVHLDVAVGLRYYF